MKINNIINLIGGQNGFPGSGVLTLLRQFFGTFLKIVVGFF